jgi:cell division protein ZapA
MGQITISINSREYAIATEDGEEAKILQLSQVLDEKAKAFAASSGHVGENMILALVGLVLADELAEAQKGKGSSGASEKARLRETDAALAGLIKNISDELKTIANKIDLL